MNTVTLEQIALGGFQVFADTTRFDLAPITLFYGPNSAGKSAIEDALRFLAALFGHQSTFRGKPHASDCVVPRESSKNVDNDYRPEWRIDDAGEASPRLEIAVVLNAPYGPYWEWLANDFGIDDFYSIDAGREKSAAIRSIRIAVTLTRATDIEPGGMNFTVHTNGDLLISADQRGAVSINLANDFLVPTGIDLPECRALAARHPDMASINGSIVELSDLGHGLAYPGPQPFINAEYQYGMFVWAWGGDEEPPRVYPAYSEMARLFNAIAEHLAGGLIQNFEAQAGFVPASRKVPDDEELTFVVPMTRIVGLPEDQVLTPDSYSTSPTGLAPRSDPAYRELANSLAAKVAWREFFPHLNAPGDTKLIDRVNESLTGPLFRERGYFLDADFSVLLGPETYGRLASGVSGEDVEKQHLALVLTINLRDAHRRTLSLVEVGSGIGYCLPVLNSVWSRPLSLVQQPELHLHPALQSAMADVLIEAVSEGHRTIVETHSEHLLLRILRRIRDTSRVASIPEEHRLFAADVAVYYFDPQPDGSTRAMRLRISPDGEFLDRWPRGFFTERDRDVFDE